MEIPGTKRTVFKILLSTHFDKGTILSGTDHEIEVLGYKKLKDSIGTEYDAAQVPSTEDLEVALGHFKFLRKYKLA